MSLSLSGVIVALIMRELNLAIALVIAESHYASGVIVALLLEGIVELNMVVASLYYPYHRAVVSSLCRMQMQLRGIFSREL